MIPPIIPKLGADTTKDRICFKFYYTRKKKSFSCSKLKQKGKSRSKLFAKLRQYQEMTVNQFKSSNGVRFRQYNGRDLPDVPEALSEDVKDQLAQYFRLDDKIRVYGYLFETDFYIIWIDTKHKISGK